MHAPEDIRGDLPAEPGMCVFYFSEDFYHIVKKNHYQYRSMIRTVPSLNVGAIFFIHTFNSKEAWRVPLRRARKIQERDM